MQLRTSTRLQADCRQTRQLRLGSVPATGGGPDGTLPVLALPPDGLGEAERMWFTETAWQPMALCGVAAIGFAAAWYQNRRMLWLAGVAVALLLIPGVWLLEQQIVTEREQVEQRIVDVTTAFQQRNVDELLSCFALNNLTDRALAVGTVAIVQVHDDLQIRDVSVTLTSGGNRAISRFRANGTFELRTYRGYHPSRWEVVWEKIAKEWKIIRVTRLDPVTGESIGIMQNG